jgi:hypothetical protein
MMASGENGLSATMVRRMPVLAQSQGTATSGNRLSPDATDPEDMNPNPGVYPNAGPPLTTADFNTIAANNGLGVYPNFVDTPTPATGAGSIPSNSFQSVLISVNALGEIQEIAYFNPSSQELISTQSFLGNSQPTLLINYIAQQGWCCTSSQGASN